MKKRAIAFVLACLMVLSLTACAANSMQEPEDPSLDAGESGSETPGNNNTDPDTGDDGNTDSNTDSSGDNDASTGSGDNDASTGSGDNDTSTGSGDNDASTGSGDNDASTGKGDNDNETGDSDNDAETGNNGNNGAETPADPDVVLVQMIEIRARTWTHVGGTIPMSPLVIPDTATNKTLKWSIVSGADLATIDSQSGSVTAKKAGTVVICAKATDGSGVSDTFSITIYPAEEATVLVEGVQPYCVNGNLTGPLYVGQTLQFGAHIEPQNASNHKVTWSLTKGADIASIDQNGVLTAYGVGTVWVYAQATDGSNVGGTYAFCIEEPLPWNGKGTQADPYQVSNAEELRAIERMLGDKVCYFKQTADIDLASYGVWAPLGMGDEGAEFRHHYDGGNHVIRNVEMPHNWKGGIFGLCISASFKNLHIENAYTTAQGHRGLMAAFSHSAQWTTFENCSATVNFPQKAGQSNSVVGGLVALFKTGGNTVTMKDCHVSGYIQGNTAGGLCGMVETTNPYAKDGFRVENCSSSATVEDCGKGNVGGLVGLMMNMTLADCTFSGEVISAGPNSGGLVGKAMEYCTLLDCVVTGTVTGGEYSDPLVGRKHDTVQIGNCIVK